MSRNFNRHCEFEKLKKPPLRAPLLAITLVMSCMAAVAAFIVMTFHRQCFGLAVILSIPAVLAILVLGYIGYTAGANPVSPEDKYTAWYLGALTILSGAMIVLWQSRISKQIVLTPTQAS
ncbi:hypothetical protein [Pseudomonas sp. Irchel s3b5]|uniref:hypothetical protein n=1 Tax=Pseudomonas sp. Irchel s3b5 TaxID=2009077 RepID=UPI002115BCB6|nr:hypothetical protein [Pseudomonas sp. Irchel s3b5]